MLQNSLLQLVVFFAKVGATAFGGGVPMHLCDHFLRNGWLTEQECLEALNLCQTLPGATSINLSTFIGWRFKGFLGALLSTIALLLPGAVVLLLASNILVMLPQKTIIQGALSATAAATVGLLLGTAVKFVLSVSRKHVSLAIALITFILIGIYRWPVPFLIVSTALLVFTCNKLQKV